jgi:regulation of enolase protein 1 (concanavalin A-like superfamily)
MPRFAAVVLCALAVLPVSAAPAPPPQPWLSGWDRPVDPDGDCLFHRHGEALALTVPGKSHLLNGKWKNAPRLLREVEGDFVAQVRVSGAFQPVLGGEEEFPFQAAGLLLLADEGGVTRLQRVVLLRDGKAVSRVVREYSNGGGRTDAAAGEAVPLRLRLERSGDWLRAGFSEDGAAWTWLRPGTFKLPRKVKVGVLAENSSAAGFTVEFDEFRLAPDN